MDWQGRFWGFRDGGPTCRWPLNGCCITFLEINKSLGPPSNQPWPPPCIDLAFYSCFCCRPPRRALRPSRPRRKRSGIRGEVSGLVRQLDSDRFDVRQKAGSRPQELVGMPDLHNCLAKEFERVLVRSDISFEVRWQLNRWCANCRPTCRPRCPRSSSRARISMRWWPVGQRSVRGAHGRGPSAGLVVDQPEVRLPGARPAQAGPVREQAGHRGAAADQSVLERARRPGSPAIRPGGTCRRSPMSRSTGG